MPGPNAASHRRASPAAAARGSRAPNPSGHHVDVAAHRYCPLIHVPVGRARTTRPSKPSMSSTREWAAMTPADEPLPTASGTASAGSRRPISRAESGPSASRSARISADADASHSSGRAMPPVGEHRERQAPLDPGHVDRRGVVGQPRGLVPEHPQRAAHRVVAHQAPLVVERARRRRASDGVAMRAAADR